MPSLFETYKSKQNITSKNDLEELRKLYNSYDAYNKKYGFAEFVALSTENSDVPLTKEILSMVKTPKKEDPLKDYVKPIIDYGQDEYKSKFKMTKEEFNKEAPFKNYRRTLAGIGESIGAGVVNFGMDLTGLFDTFGQSKVYKKIAEDKNISYDELKNKLQKEREELVKKGVTSVIKPVVGEDIYDGEILQKPEGIVGKLAVDVVPFVAGMQKFNKVLGVSKKNVVLKKGTKEIDVKKTLRNKRINLGKNLASAELSSQVVFADNPEMFVVAGYLKDKLEASGYDDNLFGEVLNYLDADEDSSAAQRRLSLLLDGAVFTGLAGTVIGGTKYSKDKLSVALQELKQNPKAVEQFKKILKPIKDKAEPFLPRKITDSIEDDVFVEANQYATDGFIKKGMTNITNKLGGIRRKFFTTRGYYSAEMHSVLKDSENAKIAWSLKANNLFDNLVFKMKTISKEQNISKEKLDLMLNDFMTGKIKSSKLPVELKEIAEEARTTIDDLSKMMLESKHVPKEIQNVIRLNMGKYIRKSYEMFENPNYKPSADVIEDAVQALAGKLKQPVQQDIFGQGRRLDLDERVIEARNIIDDILKDGKNIDTHLDQVFGVTKADILFSTRKNIDEPFRKLFGEREIKDTTKSIFTTLETLSHYITDTKMYDDLYESGKGKWFFDDATKVPTTQSRTSATIKGDRFANLNGVKTTPQIANFFNKTEGSFINNIRNIPMMNTVLGMKGFGQAFATVYSLTTHARNTIGGGVIMASNGMNPFDAETRNAFKTLKNELYTTTKSKDEALTDLYSKYQELGLVNQNVRVNEFKKLINEYSEPNWVNKLDNKFSSNALVGTGKKAVGEVNKAFNKTYVAEDDLWRIASFQKELKTLQQAFPNKTLQELEKDAAIIIRNTFPTYDLVPLGARELRAIPVFGNFYSFFAERWRNNYHSLKQGFEEIHSNNPVLAERGYERLAAKTAIGYMGAEGLNTYTKNAYGVSEEEEKAIKDLALPPWSKNGTLAFKRDEFGNIMYVDLTFSDPDAPVINTIKAFTNEIFDPETPLTTLNKRFVNAGEEALRTFLEPFTDQPLFTGRVIEAFDGKDENGSNIKGYSPQNSDIDNFFAKSKYVGEVLIPRFIKEGADYTWGEKAIKLKEGELNYGEELASKFTGQKFYTINADRLKTSLYFKITDFDKQQEESKKLLEVKEAETTDDLLINYLEANNAYYKNYVNMHQAIEAAKILNVPRSEIKTIAKKNLTKAGLNKQEINNMVSGDNYFQPIRLTENDLKAVYRKSNFVDINFTDFKRKYDSLYIKLSHLPLLELDNIDVTQRQEEAIEIIQNPQDFVREQQATGGLVKGKDDVPYTKENPADRVDPNTGKPYSDQMARLGLAEGGIAQDVLSFIAQARGYKDPSFLKKYADDVKWQEVRGAGPTTVQNNNGPARGSYQVEGREGSSRNETILQRAKNFYEEYPNAPKPKEIEYALSQQGKDLDFSTLSEATQDTLFYMDAERGTLPLDKLATGELDSKTAWMEHWNQGPDRQVMEDKWNKAQKEKEILLQQQLVQ